MNKEDATPQIKRWRWGDPEGHQHDVLPQGAEGNPLNKVYERMKEYDQGMCSAWQDEIEKLLIFAGLFSAAVVPFNIESYKWLKEDVAETSAKLLAQISTQLTPINSSSVVSSDTIPPPFTADARSVRINILWFLSLIMCLSTVVLGILCLQWLREFRREIPMAPGDAIPIRQQRYEGLEAWKVPELISTLPVLLQASVFIFFVGVLDLLWSLHHVVAAVTSVAVGTLAAALIFTTLVPLVQSFRYICNRASDGVTQCAYKSPLSWGVLRLALIASRGRYRAVLKNLRPQSEGIWETFSMTSWVDFDMAWMATKDLCEWQPRDSPSVSHDAKWLARALDWMIDKLLPMGSQTGIVPEISRSLTSSAALPLYVSNQVLQEWATIKRGERFDVHQKVPRNSPWEVQHCFMLEWFLRGLMQTAKLPWRFAIELRVRLLNTLDNVDPEQTSRAFDETLRYCKGRIPFYTDDAKDKELISQALVTLLGYHKRDLRSIDHHNDYIGWFFSQYIRHTAVKEDNAHMCCEIIEQFKSLLDAFEATDVDRSKPASEQAKWHPRSVTVLLKHLDLRELEKWEVAIQGITAREPYVARRLCSFMEIRLLPILDSEASEHCDTDFIRGQVNVYYSRNRSAEQHV